jgi:hypothetical protein
MAEFRTRIPHLPVRRWIVGGVVGLTGLIGIRRALARRTRRPTGNQLRRMSDAEFAAVIQESGLKTITSAGLAPPGGKAD